MATPDREFADVYEQHLAFVWRNLRALGVPVADVEDAAQDTFVVAHRRRADFRAGGSMRSWLYGIARRVAYRQRRGGGRRARLAEALAVEQHESSSVETLLHTQEAWKAAMSALDGLPAVQREAYWLLEFEGLTAADAGAALGVSGNTISSRLRAARAGLARHGEFLRMRDGGDLRRATAHAGHPTATQRRAALAGLAVRLGTLSGAATTGLGSLGLWAAVVAGSIVAAGVGFRLSAGDAAPDATAATDVSVAPQPDPEADTKKPEAAPRVAAASPDHAPAAQPAAPESSSRPASPDAKIPRPAAPSTLAAEAKLVRAIKTTTSTDPERALKLVTQHEARFPQGILSTEVAALRVDALCRLGKSADAKRLAGALPPTQPLSSVATVGCPKEKMTKPVGPGEGSDI